MTDPYVGRLSFFRVYSGHLTTGSSVLNSVKNQKERMGRILQMHANHREDIEEVFRLLAEFLSQLEHSPMVLSLVVEKQQTDTEILSFVATLRLV